MPTFVGLDVHLRTCHATVMDERGKILKQEKFPNERLELERISEASTMQKLLSHRAIPVLAEDLLQNSLPLGFSYREDVPESDTKSQLPSVLARRSISF